MGWPTDANKGADHKHEIDSLSLPSGPITRLRAKRFKEALNGLIHENWADFEKMKTKLDPNTNQGLVHVIQAIEEAN